jgi:hypothetical protein
MIFATLGEVLAFEACPSHEAEEKAMACAPLQPKIIRSPQ